MSNPDETIEILLVEDNEDDASLTIEALGNLPRSHVTWVEDGTEALAYLRKQGKYASAARPHLVLLDLTLPSKSGLEVLAEVKQDANLRRIPIVILSHSTADRDRAAAYDLHANCYLTKTGSLETFHTAIDHLKKFWFSAALLPPS